MAKVIYQHLLEEVPEYFPTKKYLECLKSLSEDSKQVYEELDFSGIQYLTDEVFYGLLQRKSTSKDAFDKISKIDCTGCIHLTDQALKDIGKAFPNLTKLYLDGCREITHKGLLCLGPNIAEISAVGCNVSIPVQLNNCLINYDGCPLIITVDEMKEGKLSEEALPVKESVTTKVAVLLGNEAKFSMSKFLNNEDQLEYDDIEYRNMVFKTENGEGSSIQEYFNVIECHTHASYYTPVLSEKGIYVIGVNLDGDVLQDVIMKMNYVKGLEDDPVFIIILMYNKDTMLPHDGRKQVYSTLADNIKERLDVQNTNIVTNIEEDSFDSELAKTTDFTMQQRFSRTCRVADKNKDLQFYIFRLDTDSQKICVQYPLDDDEIEDNKRLQQQSLIELEQEVSVKLEEFMTVWENACEALKSLNKSDISELKSFNSAPQVVIDVFHAILLLFDNNNLAGNIWREAKKMMADMNFLKNLLEYPVESMSLGKVMRTTKFLSRANIEMNQVRKVSKATSGLYSWVLAVTSYGKNVLPLTTKLKQIKRALDPEEKSTQKDNIPLKTDEAEEEDKAEKGPSLLRNRLQKEALKLQEREPLLQESIWKSSIEKVWSVITAMKSKKIKACTWQEIQSEITDLSDKVVAAILEKLHIQGHILFYPQIQDKIIILDILKFCQVLSKVYNVENLASTNKDRCVGLPRGTPLFDIDVIQKACAFMNRNEVDLCLTVAKYFGAVQDVPYIVGDDNEGNKGYMFSFADVESKPTMRVDDIANVVSGNRFTRFYWPERMSQYRLPTDVNVSYCYRMTYGMPHSVVTQILAECIKMGQVIHIWLFGFVVRCGAVDIKVQHNVHAFNFSSYIDVDARTTRISDDASPEVMQDYIWSVVNTYLLVIDYYIDMYKLHVMHRIICQGSCSNTELPHYFSDVEMLKEENYIPSCTLCGDGQMSKEVVGYVKGKRGLLPFHDLSNPEEKDLSVGEDSPYFHIWNKKTMKDNADLLWLCYFCGISKQAAIKLWKMQCELYPVPDSLALMCKQSNGHKLYYMSNIPLYLIGLVDLHVTMVRPCNVKVLIANESYITEGTVLRDVKELRGARMMFDLQSGKFSKITGSNRKKDHETLEAFGVGDKLTLEAVGCKLGNFITDEESVYHNRKQYANIEVVLKKNGTVFKTFSVPYRSHAGVLVTEDSVSDADNATEMNVVPNPLQDGVIIECPTYPYVKAEHYPLGSALCYKTGLGNQWAVGFVHNTEEGKITIRQHNGELIQPKREEMVPVGIYTDITVKVGPDMLKTKEQAVQYLLHVGANKATSGLFSHMYNKKMTHTPVHLRNHHLPLTCTWNEHAPCVLEQLFNRYILSEGKSGKYSAAQNHVIVPHKMSYQNLVHAPRQVLQNWDKLNVHFVCKGPQWGTYNSHEKDFHFMSPTCALDDAAPICTRLVGCKEKRNKKPEKKTSKESSQKLADIKEDEEEKEEEPRQKSVWEDLDSKIHLHAADHMQVVMAYYFMLRNKENSLPSPAMKSMFLAEGSDTELTPLEFSGLYRIMSMYKDVFMLLDRLLEVANDYDMNILNQHYRMYNRFLTQLYKEKIVQTDTRKVPKMCKAHEFVSRKNNFNKLSDKQDKAVDPFGLTVNIAEFANCVGYISLASCGHGHVGRYLKQVLNFLPNLKGLSLVKCNVRNLEGLSQCIKLEMLDVSDNQIAVISDELLSLKGTLTALNVSGNPIVKLPAFIVQLTKLRQLYIGNTLIRELPDDIGNLVELRTLSLKVTIVNKLPESISKLQMLKDLNLQGVPWIGGRDNINTFEQFQIWASKLQPYKSLPLLEIFDEADFKKNQALDKDELQVLNQRLIDAFPRFGQDCDPDDKYGGIPKEIFQLRNLRSLALGGQLIHYIPDAIENLRVLQYLYLFYTPNLLGISAKLGKAKLQVLSLAGCPKCKTPPQEIIEKGMKTVLAYLKKLSQGSTACYRTKIMFVGLGGAGKTSLTRALISEDHKAPVLTSEAITDGIDISTWTINHKNVDIQYSMWDFAGQTVYYNTHQFFLSNRALYMLVWNTRLGYEHSGLDFWLSSIACHCPKAPIFIVGTHADQITKPDLPMEKMSQMHPNIAGFFIVSSINGMGIQKLYQKIVSVTLDQPYMGEMIPESFLACEKALLHKRGTESLLKWSEVESHAQTAGVYGDEIIDAVRFLHELGTIQHFENDRLKDRVVINPQWIVDVMACVVSVHNKVVVDGYLEHKDINKIWSNYPSNLHDWLLRLTEVFDLTFPLHDRPVSVVPCLLPQTEPQYHWPNLEEEEGAKESKIVYTFDYLPAGLFNRVQVRLYQFSDTSNMWKTGSVLVKNNHHALIKQYRSNVMVKVQGLRPENILLMVHEVIESLIADFFLGVKYEYQIPCPDCTMTGVEEPTLFTSKILRKAVEMKALFLQCHSLFHTLSIMDVQSIMPPQSGGDYELQIETAVRDLDDLGSVIGTDLFLLFCDKDIPKGKEKVVDVRKIKDDLNHCGFKCWFNDKLGDMQIEQVAVAMKNAKLVLVFVSDDFVLDEQCQRMFKFARDSLRKDIQLVMVGTGRDWLKSGFIGIQVSDEVFVNLQRLHQYNERFSELESRIKMKLGSANKPEQDKFDVFISYAWVNSASAIEQGHATEKEGCLGHGDPRVIKNFLTENGISCWLDIEQVGRMGLYEDIATGMKQSKVVVACISDEYALSSNCQMEFRFAHTSLRKPIILAVVGTGFMWESTEIGMLSLGYSKINFQVANNKCHDQLIQSVQESLDSVVEEDDSSERAATPVSLTQKEQAFLELYEMAQRKFLRQVCSYLNNSEPYPRLMVADLNYDPEDIKNEEQEYLDDADITLEDSDDTKPVFVIDDLMSGQFCMKLLCEYEGGWHCVHKGIPIDLAGKNLLTMWRLVSPYMARMLAILKHSNINLNIVRTVEGEKLMKNLEEMLSTDMHIDVQPVYAALRNYVLSKDAECERGSLKRCYMPSGKMLWLCEEHQAQPRVTVLDDPELEIDTSDESPEITLMLVLEREIQKKSFEETEFNLGDVIKPASHAARHTRPLSAVSARRGSATKRSSPVRKHKTEDLTKFSHNDEDNIDVTKSKKDVTVKDSNKIAEKSQPLTEREKTTIVKKVTKENLVSMMSIPSPKNTDSDKKIDPSQACLIL